MEIYIESFLIQNILINFCLLRLVYLTTKTKTSFFKLTMSSIVGATFSVISAIFITNQILMNCLKFVCAFCMISLAYKQSKKQFCFNFILLFIYTFAFSGAITMLSSNMYLTSFGAVMTSKFSLEIITISLIVLTYIFEQVVIHLKFNLKTNKLIYKINLYLKNEKLTINAFLDTGNLLKHEGNPVIVLDFNSYLKLTNNDLFSFFNQKNSVSTNTVVGKNALKIFKIDKLEIITNKKKIEFENQFIAVTTKKFNDANYQALLSPLLF